MTDPLANPNQSPVGNSDPIANDNLSPVIGDSHSSKCIVVPNISDITSIFPTFEELHAAITAGLKIPFELLDKLHLPTPFPDLIPDFPDMPSLPSMKWNMGSIKWPSVSASYAALAAYTGQLFMVLKKACSGLFDFIGKIPFPKIPEFNIDLPDFLSMNPLKLIEAEYEKIKSGIVNEYEKLKGLMPLNMPKWSSFSIPIMEAVTAIQTAATAYLGMMIDFLISLIKKFLSFLDGLKIPHPSLPKMPKIPSMSEIASQLYDKAKAEYGELSAEISQVTDDIRNGIASEYDIIKAKLKDAMAMISSGGGSITDVLSKLKFPDLSFKIPSPLFPTFSMPEIELTHSINIMVSQIYGVVIEKLKSFIDILPLISVVWPKIKELLGNIPDLPHFCHDDVPNDLAKSGNT